ncbi:BglG family transcription antiterminator [Exiguobacterium marinum]|uniref:BglG family transcription antiterminator n=1 Tax=Exiguobacterium marinum TaxID=273528 RepID=A0ABY7WX37_9BACL|nr:BglG family transcription antiterminator [Exiguobacterium marinum]WDH75447.1 BglG family transcription antiterminator [Exiguobacterium marinum]
MTERQRKLLDLLKHKDWMSTKDIAWSLKCSERTVRTELRLLEQLPDVMIETSRGKGVRLIENLHVDTPEAEDRDSRIKHELVQLLLDELNSMQAAERMFYVSEATVKQDMDEVERLLTEHGLTFNRRTFHVEGEELVKRELLTQQLVHARFNWAHSQDVQLIETFLLQWEHRVGKRYADSAAELLQTRFLVTLKRMRRRSYVELSPISYEMVEATNDYPLLCELVEDLERALGLSIPFAERAYMMLALAGAQEFLPSEDRVMTELARTTNRFALAVIGTIYGGVLQRELFQSLLAHIRPMVYRQLIKAHVDNPLLDQIKRRFTATYAAVLRHASILEEELDLYVTEAEVGFLTLHFQTMLEERRPVDKKRILLVCTYGVGTSKLIAARLKNHFHDTVEIVGFSSLRDVEHQVSIHTPDLILSTVSLKQDLVPVHVVSAVLTEQDVAHLRQTFGIGGVSYATIASLIEHIVFIDSVLSRGHALSLLMDQVKIDSTYAGTVYAREQTGPTSIGQSVAIPHGDPEHATMNRIDVLVSKEPIEWGQEKVQLVFLLQFRDSDATFSSHLFEEIAALTEDPGLVRKLIETNDNTAFRNLLLP